MYVCVCEGVYVCKGMRVCVCVGVAMSVCESMGGCERYYSCLYVCVHVRVDIYCVFVSVGMCVHVCQQH